MLTAHAYDATVTATAIDASGRLYYSMKVLARDINKTILEWVIWILIRLYSIILSPGNKQ